MDKKKRKRPQKNEDEDEECMEIDSEDEIKFETLNSQGKGIGNTNDLDMGEVQVEFLFSELRDSYFHGLKSFVQPMLDYEVFNMSEMSDTILNQKEIGTVIKTELEEDVGSDDVDIYALCTLLKFNNYAELSFVKDFKNFIITKAKQNISSDLVDKLNYVLDNTACGLYICERAMNLPLPLIPPLINCLVNDIQGYKEDNPTDIKFDVDYIVIFSKCVKNNPQKAPKKTKSSVKEPEYLFYKYEEEEFINNAELKFLYKIPLQEKNLGFLENSNEPQYKYIAVLKADVFFKLIANMNTQTT